MCVIIGFKYTAKWGAQMEGMIFQSARQIFDGDAAALLTEDNALLPQRT